MISSQPSMSDSLPDSLSDSRNRLDRTVDDNASSPLHHLTRILVDELQRAFHAGAVAEREHHDPGPIRALYHDDRQKKGLPSDL